jgi:tetratricopeptide (TPR) repeat protein
VFCSPGRIARSALLGCLFFIACSRPGGKTQEPRIAILRFENLGADTSLDWIGRGLAELLTEQLGGRPGRYAISAGTLHALARSTGPRPSRAPGVSAESALAVLAGANRVGYGEFAVRGGRLEARLFIEDLPSHKYAQTIAASGAGADVVGVANSLARQIAPDAVAGAARSNDAVREYVKALEGNVPDDIMRDAASAIAVDPGFTPAYRLLAEWRAHRGDIAAAQALLDLAAQRAASPRERARIHLQSAGLRNDRAGRRTALAELAQADPGNPEQWRELADAQFDAHAYAEAAAALRKQLALEPDNKTALNQLGYASANAGDFPAAVEALRRYQAVAPDDPNAIDSLGDIYLASGHMREAEQFYLRAYQKNPQFLGGADLFKASIARLMTGDIPGATEIHERFLKSLPGDSGQAGELQRAEWAWTTGRRKEAYRRMLNFAHSAESDPRHETAVRCYSELAMWSLFLGDRTAAAQMAQKAVSLPGGHASAAAVVALFLTQSPAPAAEWTARATKLFPNPALAPVRNIALAGALLFDREYQPASEILQKLYDEGAHTPVDEGIPAMLAWTLLETGRYQQAEPLLRSNPIPPPAGFTVFATFYFPRLYYLRGLLAEKSGQPQKAREAYKLFLQLSGPDSLAWAEESKAANQ